MQGLLCLYIGKYVHDRPEAPTASQQASGHRSLGLLVVLNCRCGASCLVAGIIAAETPSLESLQATSEESGT